MLKLHGNELVPQKRGVCFDRIVITWCYENRVIRSLPQLRTLISNTFAFTLEIWYLCIPMVELLSILFMLEIRYRQSQALYLWYSLTVR